jgi:hypothetical protein
MDKMADLDSTGILFLISDNTLINFSQLSVTTLDSAA